MTNQDNTSVLQAQPATLTMTLQITRAATGLVETVDLVCTPVAVTINEETYNVDDTSNSCS